MGLLVPLIVSLLLIVGGGRQHARFADAAMTTAANLETLTTYWEGVLPGVLVPPVIIDLLAQQNGLRKIGPNTEKVKSEPDHRDKRVHIASQAEDDLKEISASYGSQAHRPEMEENLKEISVSYGLGGERDTKKNPTNLKNILAAYRQQKQENLKEISVSYGADGVESLKEISVSYGLEGEKDLKEISVSYGVEGRDVLKEISMSYMAEGGEGVKEISMSYGIEKNKNPMEAKASYGTERERNVKEISVSYGSGEGKDEHNDVLNQAEEDPNKATMSYGSEQEDDPNKSTMSYGSEQEEDPHKITMSYGSEQKEVPKTISSQHEAHMNGQGIHHHHAHSHSNKRQQADVFFFHDTLRPGSVITPTIPPTTSLPRLLPRRVASSIPFSSDRLPDIISMFAPASLSMTREIRWTLDTCEHPRTLPGQSASCATSLESLADLPPSLLRTRNVRAFSAADLPVEAPGTRALRGRYNVTAVRKVSGESSEIVTCHDLTYPYAVYYCHTANPTSAYTVTLTSVEDGAVPKTMEALAVCHLDTSKWSPKNPFFELHNLKPGEVTVCHFLTKLSIIWVPGSEQGEAHATAR
ncbi:hypothetical protein ACQ4PT_009122 [Festuca glaucescens]